MSKATTIANQTQSRLRYWPAQRSNGGKHEDAVALKGLQGGAERLAGLTLLFIGLGAVNGLMFQAAARMGFGRIIGCDPARYGPFSSLTQWMLPMDAGRLKAEVQGAAAHRINPAVDVVTFAGFFQDAPRYLLRQADMFILAGDNVDAVIASSRAAIELEKVLVESVVFGEQWIAYARRYELTNPEAVCPACHLGAAEWQSRKTRHGCSFDAEVKPGGEPTRTIPIVTQVAAGLGLAEVVKQAAGEIGGLLDGEELAYWLKSHTVLRTRFSRNRQCRLGHEPHRVVDIPSDPADITLNDLAKAVGASTPLQVKSEKPWIVDAVCPDAKCRRTQPIRRFAALTDAVGRCDCGKVLFADVEGRRSTIPAADLAECRYRPLAELGLRSGNCVYVATGETWAECFLGGSTFEEWLSENAQEVVQEADQ